MLILLISHHLKTTVVNHPSDFEKKNDLLQITKIKNKDSSQQIHHCTSMHKIISNLNQL